MDLYRIQSDYFTAGILVSDTFPFVVLHAAPIVVYMKGWLIAEVQRYALNRKWKVSRVQQNVQDDGGWEPEDNIRHRNPEPPPNSDTHAEAVIEVGPIEC